MDSKNIQIGLINVVMGVGFLLLLLMQRTLTNLEAWIFWIATATFFFHWYWGLVYFISYVGPTENMAELAFDFVTVGVVISTLVWLDVPYIWFAIFAATFACAVAKYLLAQKYRRLSSHLKNYISEKIRIHVVATVLFMTGSILAFAYKFTLFLGILALALHLFTLGYMQMRKVYNLHD